MALGSVSGFYQNGRPSGLPADFEDQLVNARADMLLTPIEQDMEAARLEQDVFESLNTQFTSFLQAVDALDKSSDFDIYGAISTDEDALVAKASSSAREGSYNVSISSTAAAHTHLIGLDDSDGGTGVTQGSDDPDDASLINADMEISFHLNGSQVTYTTGSSTTLNSLAESITDDENGIRASVTNMSTSDTPQYVMTLKSESTGAGENRITADGIEDNVGVVITDTTSSGQTLFTAGAAEQEETQAGTNATFTVDGVSYERSSNQVEDVISGLTLNLKGTGSDLGLQVTQATEEIVANINAFVQAFNTTQSYINKGTAFNPATQQGGPLMGSSVVRSAERGMASIVMNPVAGTSDNAYQYLSQIGIQFNQDGTLELDSKELVTAIETNPEDVEALFTGDGGVGSRLKSFLQGYTNSYDGLLTSKVQSFDTSIEQLQEDYEDAQEDIKNYEERLVAKYTAMEQVIMSYQSQSDVIESMTEQFKIDSKA